jgi:HSP20 family protein
MSKNKYYADIKLLSKLSTDFTGLPERWNGNGEMWSPSLEISNSKTHIEITVELPAVKKEDVFVSVRENILTIIGTRKGSGQFMRSLLLPYSVYHSRMESQFKDGILIIKLAKH